MEKIEILLSNQFYIDKISKTKLIAYKSFRKTKKDKGYEWYNKREKLKLGIQLCDFLNTDFHSFENVKKFIDQYSVSAIAEIGKVPIYTYYTENEYNEMVKTVIERTADKIKKIQKAFIKDIKYIYNLNNLEEVSELSPAQRLYILRTRKEKSQLLNIFEHNKIKLCFNNFGDFNQFPITKEEDAQKIAKFVRDSETLPYNYLCENIIPSFIIELFELTSIENIEIKKCKNCGKFFVPEKRSDELYCNNIFENDKTCKEVGPFKVKQKLMEENNDL